MSRIEAVGQFLRLFFQVVLQTQVVDIQRAARKDRKGPPTDADREASKQLVTTIDELLAMGKYVELIDGSDKAKDLTTWLWREVRGAKIGSDSTDFSRKSEPKIDALIKHARRYRD